MASTLSADLGEVQGGVLSPMLFNIYLEEALGTTDKLKEIGEEEQPPGLRR